MDKKKILIADDEENILDFVNRGLSDFGYDVTTASNGNDAWKLFAEGNPFDLLILDIRMPGMTGLDLCRRFRERFGFTTPILMLTALTTTDDIVYGLHAGADDYIVKPFKFMELIARVEANLRRADILKDKKALTCGDLRLDSHTHKACRGDISADLSQKEYRLLEYFILHQGEILSRRQLLKDVWDKDFDTATNIVDVYVRYLRNKIDDPFSDKLIHTIVGKGYCMKAFEK